MSGTCCTTDSLQMNAIEVSPTSQKSKSSQLPFLVEIVSPLSNKTVYFLQCNLHVLTYTCLHVCNVNLDVSRTGALKLFASLCD